MYMIALVSPVDSVLANEWFGFPLPSEFHPGHIGPLRWIALGGAALVALVILILLLKLLKKRADRLLLSTQLFLLCAVVLSILPLIVFTPKPSETYMYLAVAFGALLFCSVLNVLLNARTVKGRLVFASIVGLLTVSFSCATWVRNQRVASCAATAQRIMAQVQEDRLKHGSWYVWLAEAPGEPKATRYGIYGYRGLGTIGQPGVQSALRVANGNEMLSVNVVEAESLADHCNDPREVCLVVHDDGKVDELNPPLLHR
jgi:hypothetical protein